MAAAFLEELLRCIQQYYNRLDDLAAEKRLEEKLQTALVYLSNAEVCSQFSREDLVVIELLSYCPLILADNRTNSTLRDGLQTLLYYFAKYCADVRAQMAADSCGAVFAALKLSLKHEAGPQSLCCSLRLLQLLTYDANAELAASWSDELVSFLLGEICRPSEMEWTPLSLGVLCCLAANFPSVCERIRKSSRFASLCRRLIGFLNHDRKFVVICSLSLVDLLDESLREKVYLPKNLSQTFQCIFNVLVKGDANAPLTRFIAADLLKRLVVVPPPPRAAAAAQPQLPPQLSALGSALLSFKHLDRSLQQVVALLVELQDARDQLLKMYELVLFLCTLVSLRGAACSAVLNCEPVDTQRLTTPLLAATEAALWPLSSSLSAQVSICAVRLLQLVFQHVVDMNEKMQSYVPPETLLRLVEDGVKTTIQTNDSSVVYSCRRIIEGLRLADVAVLDDNLRPDLLAVLPATFCAHLAEFQLLSNPVSLRGAHSTTGAWSKWGVEIVLELVHLLNVLKDYSKAHKDQYWRMLKDERLVAFLAYAIAHDSAALVDSGLRVVLKCHQCPQFASNNWLGEMIAANVRRLQQPSSSAATAPTRSSLSNGAVEQPSDDGDVAVDELIDKLKRGVNVRRFHSATRTRSPPFQLQDTRVSQLALVYERKIKSLQVRERELQSLLDARQTALQQNERVLSQYRSERSDAEAELTLLRSVMRDSEAKSEETTSVAARFKQEKSVVEAQCEQLRRAVADKHDQLRAHREDFDSRADALKREIANLNQALEDLRDENEKEQEMHEVLRKHHDDMKRKFDLTAKKLMDAEVAIRSHDKQLNDKELASKEMERIMVKLETTLADREDAMAKQEDQLGELQRKRQELTAEVATHKARIQSLLVELEEQKKVTKMIHQLTGK